MTVLKSLGSLFGIFIADSPLAAMNWLGYTRDQRMDVDFLAFSSVLNTFYGPLCPTCAL